MKITKIESYDRKLSRISELLWQPDLNFGRPCHHFSRQNVIRNYYLFTIKSCGNINTVKPVFN